MISLVPVAGHPGGIARRRAGRPHPGRVPLAGPRRRRCHPEGGLQGRRPPGRHRPDDLAARTSLVLSESARVLRERDGLIITETRHGFVCANAGVDLSNVAEGQAALLPVDPDRSARHIRDALRARTGLEVGVIVSDTFGRPWRTGLTDVAIGCAGIAAVVDLRGTTDAPGRELAVTEVCVADELAAAAELAKGKASGIPVVIVRGADPSWFRESLRPGGDRPARTTRTCSASESERT